MIKTIGKYVKVTVKASPGFFILNILVIFLFRLFRLGTDIALKFATDSAVHASSIWKIIFPFLFFFLMMTLSGNTGNMNNLVITMYTKNAKKIFSKLFMKAAYKEKQDSFYNNTYYDNYEFVKRNIDNTSQINVSIFNNLLAAIFSFLIGVAAVSFFNPFILLFIFVVSVLMVYINQKILKKRVELNKTYIKEERKAEYYSQLLSDKANAKELRIFHLKDLFVKRWSESFSSFSLAKYQFEQKALLLSNIPSVVENVLTAILLILFLYDVNSGKLSIGDFVLLYRMMWQITDSIMSIIDIISNNIMSNYHYIKRYDELVGDINMDAINQKKQDNIPKKEFDSLLLKNVCYSYPNQNQNKKAVYDVNLSLKKGEIISILGYNGSGKSTLSKIICGILEDYEGTVLLNGQDIKKMEQEELYQYFGIGFQDFTKYSLTIKDNVAVGMIEKKEDEMAIKTAMEKGNLQSILDRLPHGENTVLGKEYDSEGQDLSGGQWQRVVLSRAYMGEPEILILDEPTASIDPLEEMRLLQNLRKIINGKTAILISHRIGFARLSDRICMMENGRIMEEGSHEELIERKGKYYNLFLSQKQLYEQGEG